MKNINKNFLPNQYDKTNSLKINHNYLAEQFQDYELILEKIANVVKNQDFTLGRQVDYFEDRFKELINCKHAIGVGSGTDALFLSLKSLNIKEGDEVITTPFTFYATIGAIVTAGAKPVFVDVGNDFNIDATLIENAITEKTKAIVPVHWAGKPCNMNIILEVSKKYKLNIVEDACHAYLATYKGDHAGTFGISGCFSLHPLKNLNVWGDGGVVVTNNDEFANNLRLLRNHGLIDRNYCEVFAYNSRLDTIQAVVAMHLLEKINFITNKRIFNANYLDLKLNNMKEVKIPDRDKKNIKSVHHIYPLQFEKRDELMNYLISYGVDAKIHYPVPMHLQPAAKTFGYREGDFPKAEKISKETLSLPVHEFISEDDLNFMIKKIKDFYKKS